MSQDFTFRPKIEPARTLYDAFQAEARNRPYRSVEQWIEAERQAVWRAARDYARQHGLRVPTLTEVHDAENYALGSVDYGAKWAYRVAEKMNVDTRTDIKPAQGQKEKE